MPVTPGQVHGAAVVPQREGAATRSGVWRCRLLAKYGWLLAASSRQWVIMSSTVSSLVLLMVLMMKRVKN
jgi:hypothetical protein